MNLNELNALAKSINDRQEAISILKDRAVGTAGEAVKEAILQGQELLKAKAMLPHGMFGTWLLTNCPLVASTQAHRYMRLASNLHREVNLENAQSIRQALTLIEDSGAKSKAQPKTWPPYIQALGKAGRLLEYINHHPITEWPIEGKDRLKEDLEPVAKSLWPERWQDADRTAPGKESIES